MVFPLSDTTTDKSTLTQPPVPADRLPLAAHRDPSLGAASIQFYSRLPATDDRPLSAGTVAADATQARFVAVTARPITLSTILPATFFRCSGKTAVKRVKHEPRSLFRNLHGTIRKRSARFIGMFLAGSSRSLAVDRLSTG